MKVAFRPGQEPNKTALQSSNLARRGKKRGKPLPHAATKTKTVPKTTKHQKRKKAGEKMKSKAHMDGQRIRVRLWWFFFS